MICSQTQKKAYKINYFKNRDNVSLNKILICLIFVLLIPLSYSINSNSDSKTNLTIFSEQDLNNLTTYYSFQQITFYANYTNITTKLPYGTSATCKINITSLNNDTYINMTYNITSTLFEYTNHFILGGNYNYKIKCNSTTLNLTDNIVNDTIINIQSNSNLNTFDNSYNSTFYTRKNKNITFYANYTSVFTNLSIQNSSCNIIFEDYTTNLTYNSISKYYEYTRQFSSSGNKYYNVSCINQNHSQYNYENLIYINPIFTKENFSFIGTYESSCLVTDFNNNNKYDFLLSGKNTDLNASIYEFDNTTSTWNTLTNYSNTLIPQRVGSIATADFNNDGLLDIITCGDNTTNSKIPQTNIYFNKNNKFEKQNFNIQNLQYCSIAVGDIDNDGLIDFAISGTNDTTYTGAQTLIYKNTKNNFTLFQTLPGVYRSSINFIDLDNDEYLDLIYSGRYGILTTDIISQIWINNKINYSFNSYFANLSYGSISTLNFNNDNYADIIINGLTDEFNTSSAQTLIYKNNNGTLINTQNLTGFSKGSISVGDINNDGFVDLYLNGINTTSSPLGASEIYYGNGINFTKDNLQLDNFWLTSSTLFDYDNDGDLDLFSTGRIVATPTTILYNNTYSKEIKNNPPLPPTNLNATYNFSTNELIITWDKSTDDITPQNGLSYNLQIGTINNEHEILSGLPLHSSNPTNGYFGNVGYKNNMILHIPSGNYIIKVQAIDNGMKKSNWTTITTNYCKYNNVGDWNIVGNCVITDTINIVQNKSININNGGTLTLINSNVQFDPTTNFSQINIQNGTLELINTNLNGTQKTNLILNSTSQLSLQNSEITNINLTNIFGSITSFNQSQLSSQNTSINNQIITIYDSTLNTNLSLKNTTINIINSTITQNSSLDIKSLINEKWYLNLQISITKININYTDKYSNSNTLNTNSNSYITLTLKHKTQNYSSTTTYSNYTLIFTKDKYFSQNISVNMSTNQYRIITLEPTLEPDYEEFKNYRTTNFTLQAFNHNLTFKNAIISKPNISQINFTQTINFSNINLSKAIDLEQSYIYLNSTLYPQLNTSAKLTFYNLSYTQKPTIFKDNILCTNDCLNQKFNLSEKTFSFDVNGFSNYSITPNSKILWTDKDLTCNIKNNLTTITVKYLNHTNDNINNSTCYITISSTPYTNTIMTYNLTAKTHQFKNSITTSDKYNFTVKCNTTQNYETINLTDSIYVRKNKYDAQFNINNNFNFPNVLRGSVLFGDNSLIVTGNPDQSNTLSNQLSFYNIENNTLMYDALKTSSIVPISRSAIGIFDYNNDGYEDIIVIGKETTDPICKIYKNNGNTYSLAYTLTGLYDGSVDIGDYDNDGYQDLLLSGINTLGNPQSIIYKNNKGSNFVEKNFNITHIKTGTSLFIDYNNDNYLDIISNGLNYSDISQTIIYTNINGTYFLKNQTLSNYFSKTYKSSLAIGDIDNDKDFDLLIDGSLDTSDTNVLSKIYTNNNINFTETNSLNKTYLSSNLFWNYNLDNYTDVIINGRNIPFNPSSSITQIYTGNTLTDIMELSGTSFGSISTSDYDNDGDLDLIISGDTNGFNSSTTLYKNDIASCIENLAPTTPILEAKYNETTNELFINWSNSYDENGGITYNLRIGNTANPNALYSGVNPKTSKPANAGYGNQRFRNNLTIHITKQCFKIQIQAIDNTFKKSDWSNITQISFTEIANDGLDQDCDGTDLTTGGQVSSGSSDKITKTTSSSTYVPPTTQETTPEETPKETPKENSDNQETSNNNDENKNTKSSSSNTNTEQTIEKIFNNILGHKRKAIIENDKTYIQEKITNKFVYKIEDIQVQVVIPKNIISSAQTGINWNKSPNFYIIKDDPIIAKTIPSLNPGEDYYLEYELNEKLTQEQIDQIALEFSYKDITEEQNDFLEQIENTKKYVQIKQKYETDTQNNKTKFTLDIDFKNESILYNVSIYQEIPKCLIVYLNENFIESNYDFEIVDEDPLIVWHFDQINKNEQIQFAIKSIADDDCNNQAETFALAKSIYILDKKLNWGPYKTKENRFRPGIGLSTLFVLAFTIVFFYFLSFTQTQNDKLKLAQYIEKVKQYRKKYHLSDDEIKNNLVSDGASQDTINEIFTKNLFRRLFLRFEIAFEEILLFILIIINVFDALEILPGDFDFIKKIISWSVLSYLFYQISITNLLFGERKKKIDITLLSAFFLLILKNFIVYAIGAIQDFIYFSDLITLILKYSDIIESSLFILGSFIVLICTVILTFTVEVNEPSVISLLNIKLYKQYVIRRFFLFYITLMLFFTTIYNLTFEWLAIAIDAPLVTLCILGYFILLVKHHEKFSFTKFLSKVGNGLNTFYKDILQLFTKKSLFILGVSGLLILHILTEIGNFIMPYVLGKADSLYFGATITDYSKSTLISLMENGHAPIFSLRDIFTNNVSSIFFNQISDINSWYQILNLFLNYFFNITFVILLIVLPGIIWIHMYRHRVYPSNKIYKVQLSKFTIALFIISFVVFFANPAFTVGAMAKSQYSDVLIDKDVVKGIDIQTMPINPDVSFMPLIIGFSLASLALFGGRLKFIFNNIISLFVLLVFTTYISLFFLQIQTYYFDTIRASLNNLTTIDSLILGNLALMYILTILFYLGGIAFFVYGLWKSDEIPFEEKYVKYVDGVKDVRYTDDYQIYYNEISKLVGENQLREEEKNAIHNLIVYIKENYHKSNEEIQRELSNLHWDQKIIDIIIKLKNQKH